MENQSSGDALMRRIADLEAELQAQGNNPETTCSLKGLSLADIDHDHH